MTGRRMHLSIAAGFAALVALAALTSVSRAARSEPAQGAPHTATVATLTTHDVRVVVVARRIGGGETPTAEVRIAGARRVAGGWRELGEARVRGTYFWHTVTGPQAVCRLELEAQRRRTAAPRFVAVRLLVSPSLGCGPTTRLPLPSR